MQYVRDGIRYGLRRVERRQHRGFQRVHIPLVLRFIPAVLPDDAVQLHRRGEQFEVGLRPMHGVGQFPCRVQDALQAPEAAVTLQQRTFPFRRGAPFPVQRERRAYRLDVVAQLLFPIERHDLPPDKARRFPPAPYRAGHGRATGRRCRPTYRNRRTGFSDGGTGRGRTPRGIVPAPRRQTPSPRPLSAGRRARSAARAAGRAWLPRERVPPCRLPAFPFQRLLWRLPPFQQQGLCR